MTENCLSESAIFKVAVSLSPDQRKAYLMQACGPNSDLRRDVEALLRAHETAGGFLRDPPDRPQAAVDCISIAERPGTIIGPYKLLEQIGEGGFGVVFMAEQLQPIQRKVALKVIKPGMDTRQVVARFEAERQALALMDDPNIARVLDAGTTESSRPYFVMELVHGVPVTDYCDRHRLAVRERLELFITICQAVQHAHQKGVIHRDLKPTNVLVTQHDGRPLVKVIDFGVAKATRQKLTEKTLFTGIAQLIGTPLYMSPEQTELNAPMSTPAATFIHSGCCFTNFSPVAHRLKPNASRPHPSTKCAASFAKKIRRAPAQDYRLWRSKRFRRSPKNAAAIHAT